MRDPSSIAIGVVLPVMLILLFGYGLSLDVKNVPVAVVLEDTSPDATELAAGFELSPYFEAQVMTSMRAGRGADAASARSTASCASGPISRAQLKLGEAEVQVLVHGTDANRARIIRGLCAGRGRPVGARRQAAEGKPSVRRRRWSCIDRLWFNEANDSHYFLVPGLIVLVMTLIGAFLTALVMAREWERGTLEALFVTPVRTGEISARQDDPLFRAGHDRAWRCASPPRSSCSTCRSAARWPCWSARRCSTCWSRSASAC